MVTYLKIGSQIINEDAIISVRLDTDIYLVNCLGDATVPFPAAGEEGRAVAWWFGESDRARFEEGRTFDLVAEHRVAIEEGTTLPFAARPIPEACPGEADAAYCEQVRTFMGYPAGLGNGGAA